MTPNASYSRAPFPSIVTLGNNQARRRHVAVFRLKTLLPPAHPPPAAPFDVHTRVTTSRSHDPAAGGGRTVRRSSACLSIYLPVRPAGEGPTCVSLKSRILCRKCNRQARWHGAEKTGDANEKMSTELAIMKNRRGMKIDDGGRGGGGERYDASVAVKLIKAQIQRPPTKHIRRKN